MVKAMALEIAERKLLKAGWNFSLEDIGASAARIIAAMDKEEEILRKKKGE